MPSITDTARKLFDACESGKGWEACRAFCHADATFNAQADALAEVKTIEAYTDFMASIYHIMPDARYEVHAFAGDESTNRVMGFGTFYATHTEEGGPVPPTGKSLEAEYVYIFTFDGDKVKHMTKVWNDVHSFKQVGWA